MSQINSKLRRGAGMYFHWCPACEEIHALPDSWQFNGNLANPTFSPSFRHSSRVTKVIKDGKWTGEWVDRPYCCHYILTAGVLNFCSDCTHTMAGQSAPLPELPAALTDEADFT